MDGPVLKPGSLLRQFSPRRVEYLKVWAPIIAIVSIGFLLASVFVKPAPPSRITIASGSRSGAYFAFASRYAATFAEAGIDLVVRETAGTRENYQLLGDSSSGVSAAIVQGGVIQTAFQTRSFESVASLYYEPIWIFHRGDEPFRDLKQLAGLTIAIGPPGSGSRPVAEALLQECGLVDRRSGNSLTTTAGDHSTTEIEALRGGTRLSPLGNSLAAKALLAGEIDAAILVISPLSETVKQLIAADDVQLANLDLADAYARRLPYLSAVRLPRGVLDLSAVRPRSDVTLLAPTANLIVRGDIHASVVPLFAKAVKDAHAEGGLLAEPGTFPSSRHTEFPLNVAAKHYFENGSSFLYRVLPFWAASLADRMKIFALPLLTLILPMFRIAPPLYRWSIRRRIYLWYRVLRKIDEDLHRAEAGDRTGLDADIAHLVRLNREVSTTTIVPLSYMQEFYQLRMHIELTRYRVHELLKGLADAQRKPFADSLAMVTEPPAPAGQRV